MFAAVANQIIMRTVIFFGLILIAGALDKEPMDDMVTKFLAYVAVVAMIMDIVDFVRGLGNKH